MNDNELKFKAQSNTFSMKTKRLGTLIYESRDVLFFVLLLSSFYIIFVLVQAINHNY